MLKSRNHRASVAFLAPRPYRRGHDYTSVRCRCPALIPGAQPRRAGTRTRRLAASVYRPAPATPRPPSARQTNSMADDVWRRAGRQISVPHQQLLIHRPRHVGQDARPIHNGPLSCPRRRRRGPPAKSYWTISGTAMLTPLGRWASGRSSFLTERVWLRHLKLYAFLAFWSFEQGQASIHGHTGCVRRLWSRRAASGWCPRGDAPARA